MNASAVSRGFCDKTEKNENEVSSESSRDKLGGFAKAFERHSAPHLDESTVEDKLPNLPFATLLRNSKFIDVN